MNLEAQSRTRRVSTRAGVSPALVRRGSFAVLVLLIIEFGIGMYVNAGNVYFLRAGRSG
jgi:hypothetical protein